MLAAENEKVKEEKIPTPEQTEGNESSALEGVTALEQTSRPANSAAASVPASTSEALAQTSADNGIQANQIQQGSMNLPFLTCFSW